MVEKLLLLIIPSLALAEIIHPTTPKVGCLHSDGKVYAPGSTFHPNPCEHCVCPEHGGHIYCAIMDCMMPPCVDAVRKPDQCCATCPNGPNCYLGNKIIPANKDHEEMEMICRCPQASPGHGFGLTSHAQAHCTPSSPDIVTPHPESPDTVTPHREPR